MRSAKDSATAATSGTAAVLLPALLLLGCGPPPHAPVETVETVLDAADSTPLVSLRLLFRIGSAQDPPGREGLAALTARMLAYGGSEHRSYGDILAQLYPTAASIEALTDRDSTLIATQVHRDQLQEVTALLAEVVLRPAFTVADLERNRQHLLAELEALRSGDDEALGLEMLQQRIFAGHPYGHAVAGTSAGLAAVTVDDVRAFYERHFTRSNLILGIGGGFPQAYAEELQARLADLPAGYPPAPLGPAGWTSRRGRHFTLVEKRTDAVGIHLGARLALDRTDAEYYPLLIANSLLGEHRTFYGRLQQELRTRRGLNYGSYSYIEHWHEPAAHLQPAPNVPRRAQYFSIWLRPVEPHNALFALRAALYELDRLLAGGLATDEVELTRDYLINYSKIWARSISGRLGFHMDSRYYGMQPFQEAIEARLDGASVPAVEAAASRYLQSRDLEIVLVTADAKALAARIESQEASLPRYGVEVDAATEEEDARIARLPLEPASLRVVAVEDLFVHSGASSK